MPSFSKASLQRLHTCHPDLQVLLNIVVREFDCTVLCGHRSKAEQHAAFALGNSKLDWPFSKHNKIPSEAVDVAPYIPGRGIVIKPAQVYYFAGWVMARARRLYIPIRWGGDWDKDKDVQDQTFNDLCHFELTEQ